MNILRENICLAVAVGALRVVAESNGEGRKKGGCLRLADMIMGQSPTINKIKHEDIDTLTRCIDRAASMMDSYKGNFDHVHLNLAAFCLEEIKQYFSENIFYNLRKLFTYFDKSDCYEDIRFGDRLFTRLMTEVEIESAMGKGKGETMKILVNGGDAICNYCGHRGAEAIAGVAVCPFCESEALKDEHWNEFIPKWKKDSRNPTRVNWTRQLRRYDDIHQKPR